MWKFTDIMINHYDFDSFTENIFLEINRTTLSVLIKCVVSTLYMQPHPSE